MRLAIGEVAERSGLRASTLRYYEGRGLLATAVRENGRRIYGEEVFDRLAVIELAKRSGFTLEEIRELFVAPDRGPSAARRWRETAGAKLTMLERRIEEAQAMRALLLRLSACSCRRLVDCGRALNAARGQPRSWTRAKRPKGRRGTQSRGANAS